METRQVVWSWSFLPFQFPYYTIQLVSDQRGKWEVVDLTPPSSSHTHTSQKITARRPGLCGCRHRLSRMDCPDHPVPPTQTQSNPTWTLGPPNWPLHPSHHHHPSSGRLQQFSTSSSVQSADPRPSTSSKFLPVNRSYCNYYIIDHVLNKQS
jgi:hypothetical protein